MRLISYAKKIMGFMMKELMVKQYDGVQSHFLNTITILVGLLIALYDFAKRPARHREQGRMEWDSSHGHAFVNDFNRQWLVETRNKLKENETIWISGTYHNIYSIAQTLNDLGIRLRKGIF